jgi:hypothetical protein
LLVNPERIGIMIYRKNRDETTTGSPTCFSDSQRESATSAEEIGDPDRGIAQLGKLAWKPQK